MKITRRLKKKKKRNSLLGKVGHCFFKRIQASGGHDNRLPIWNVIQKQEVNNCSAGENKLYLGQRRLNKSPASALHFCKSSTVNLSKTIMLPNAVIQLAVFPFCWQPSIISYFLLRLQTFASIASILWAPSVSVHTLV